jgi:hypothetical protein
MDRRKFLALLPAGLAAKDTLAAMARHHVHTRSHPDSWVVIPKLQKGMVGTSGFEPLTSTVSR